MAEQEIHRQVGFLSKHKEVGRLPGRLMGSGIIVEDQLWEVFRPISFFIWRKGTKQVEHSSNKAFTLSIPLWVIRRGALHTTHTTAALRHPQHSSPGQNGYRLALRTGKTLATVAAF